MYNIIPLILILISLGLIIAIVFRKFPMLANLDIESIPAEKEAKFKEQIISNRLQRGIGRWNSRVLRFFRPIISGIVRLSSWFYNKLHEMKEQYKKEPAAFSDDIKQKINLMLAEADEMIENEDLIGAEKKLIEVISLDNKNVEAFKVLGQIYFERKNFIEAKQTFEHILRLGNDEDAEIHFELATISLNIDQPEEAEESIKNALNLEPNNPRFLDTLLEISIINKDKILAEQTLEKLKNANPENKKLKDLAKKISELE